LKFLQHESRTFALSRVLHLPGVRLGARSFFRLRRHHLHRWLQQLHNCARQLQWYAL